jgi:hypothetical protein
MNRRMIPAALVALVAIVVLAEAPLPAMAVGTLDPAAQNMGPLDDSAPVSAHLSVAQTFTPALSGQLDTLALSVGLDPQGIPSDPLLVEMESTVDGRPSGSVLARGTLQPADITGNVPEFPIAFVAFATPAVVAAGTQYALVLSSRESARPYGMGATDKPYAGGQLLLDYGTGWSTLDGTAAAGLQLRFQALVTPAPGHNPWPIRYTDFGAYAMCDFDDGTQALCPDQQHPYVPCYLPDGRTVLCSDRDVQAPQP